MFANFFSLKLAVNDFKLFSYRFTLGMDGQNQSLVLSLHNFFYDHADPRIRDMPFMGSPFAIIFVYVCYVLLVLYVFPVFMVNRKPFNFTKLFAAVDVLVFFAAGYIFAISAYGWSYYNWMCELMDPTNSFLGLLAVNGSWCFLMTKFVYTLQSVVYVMAKRDGPMANYILVHHATFPLFIWTIINYYPGGHVSKIYILN